MRLGEIDLSLVPLDPKLSICLPNRMTIGKLTEAMNISNNVSLNKNNEISFKIPFQKEKNRQLVKNENIDKLRVKYCIKLELGNNVEYYIINEITDNAQNEEYREVHAYTIEYELNDKIIQYFSDTNGATQIISQALEGTLWSIFYIDSDYDIKHRTFEDVQEITVLSFLYQVAETFGGVLQFNTVDRTVSLVKEENIGHNKGLKLSYGKYLKTLNKTASSDEQVTRLYVYGSEEMSINTVNPTGSSYIEDFSYFLYPFQRDSNKNTISSSYYMSDSLCHALLDYQELVESKQNEFTTKLASYRTLYSNLSILETEMSVLESEKKEIEDAIYLKKGTGQDYSQESIDLANKQDEINNKQSQINTTKTDINTVTIAINQLRDVMSIENNFTADQIKERSMYIIDKVWRDENIIDEDELYEAGLEQFKKLKEPQTTFSIDIVNFLNIITEQRNWGKLSLGDTVTIQYELMNIEVQAKIVEIQYDYQDNNIRVTISNTFDLRSSEQKVLDKLYDSYSTSSSLDMSKYKWNGSYSKIGEINEIINSTWDANKRTIEFGVNNSISMSGKGLVIQDPTNPNNVLVAQSGILAISNDNMATWKHAITSSGIVGERIFGKILAGVNLTIENQSGTFKVDQNGATLDGMSLTITGGLPKSQLDPTFAEGLLELNKTYTNGIKIDTTDGIVVTRNDDKVKTTLNATEGISIQKYNGTSWIDQLNVDTSGNVVFSGTLSAASGTFSGTVSASTIDTSSFKGGSIDIGNGNFTVNSSGYLTAKSGSFSGSITASTISSDSTINGSTIIGTNISGGTISGATITTTQDVQVGRNLTLGDYYDTNTKQITFNSSSSIYGSGTSLSIYSGYTNVSAYNSVEISSDTSYVGINGVLFYGSSVDFSGKTISGITVNGSDVNGYVDYANYANNASFADTAYSVDTGYANSYGNWIYTVVAKSASNQVITLQFLSNGTLVATHQDGRYSTFVPSSTTF